MLYKQVLQFIDGFKRKRFITTISNAFLLKFFCKIFFRERMAQWITYDTITFHQASFWSKYKKKVSPRKPIRIASRGITSVGAIFPRFTLQPINSKK